jgi:HD superfamily phosphohydrolase YqeK
MELDIELLEAVKAAPYYWNAYIAGIAHCIRKDLPIKQRNVVMAQVREEYLNKK